MFRSNFRSKFSPRDRWDKDESHGHRKVLRFQPRFCHPLRASVPWGRMSPGDENGGMAWFAKLNPVGFFNDSIDEVPWHFCLNGK